MRIKKLNIEDKKATVILGAGASRGAKCFEEVMNPAPLDADFFTIMQRVCHHDPRLEKFLEFVRAEFGAGASPGMEELFTQLEALARFHDGLKIKPGPKVKRYNAQLAEFVAMTATFFRQVFCDSKGVPLKCDYHEAMADALNAEDTVISFNYDCLMDAALRDKGMRSWSAESGYHVPVTDGADSWNGKGMRGRWAKHPIKLLKLHGSLNWDRSTAGSLMLRPDPYLAAARCADEVVPPVWNKTIGGDAVFSEVWKEARRILPTGQIMVVAGYSVPPTDLLSQALIRISASERTKSQKLTHLVVANPSQEARAKLIGLVRPALDEASLVIELGSMEALGKLLS
jgi:hypothetical protein